MINDLLNSPIEVKIEGKKYQIEFDNTSYAIIEKVLGIGIFKILGFFVLENNLEFAKCVDILCAGMVKHHTKKEIAEVKAATLKAPAIMFQNINLLKSAFSTPLMMPEIAELAEKNKKKSVKKKTLKK